MIWECKVVVPRGQQPYDFGEKKGFPSVCLCTAARRVASGGDPVVFRINAATSLSVSPRSSMVWLPGVRPSSPSVWRSG